MIKQIFKSSLYNRFYVLRSIAKPLFRFKEVVVLMYHSVDNNNWYASINPEIFDKQMKYLFDNRYNVVSLNEIIDYIKGQKDLPDRTVAITFDDGYLDNYQEAFPILKKYQLPATIFLATKEDRKTGCSSEYPLIAWPQAKEMMSSGLISIESHSDTHPNLKEISSEQLEREIKTVKQKIKDNLNYQSSIFAYPGGKFNQKVIDCLKTNDFKAGFTTDEGLIKKGDDPFRLKRISVHRSVSFYAFKVRLTKAIDWYAGFLKFLRKIRLVR